MTMYEIAITFWGSVAGFGLIVAAVGGTVDAVARGGSDPEPDPRRIALVCAHGRAGIVLAASGVGRFRVTTRNRPPLPASRERNPMEPMTTPASGFETRPASVEDAELRAARKR